MKFFGKHLPNADVADTERPLRVFSLGRLTWLGIAATGVVLLIAAAAAYLINSATVERYYKQRAETLAGELAYGLVGLVQEAVAKVEWVALDPQVVQAIKSDDPVLIANSESRLTKQFPELLRARLVPSGVVGKVEGGTFPQLGFADLEMLRAGEATGTPPPIEAHFFGMETAHVDIVRPVRDANGLVIGQLLASFGGDFVQRALDKVSVSFGYVEIRQSDSEHAGVLLAKRGRAELAKSAPGQVVSVLGTRWELTYWPPAADRNGMMWRSAALWAVFGLAFLMVSLVAYALHRILSKALQADLESIVEAVREINSGRSFKAATLFHLRDVQGKLEILEAMAPMGDFRPQGGMMSMTGTTMQQAAVHEQARPNTAKVPASIFRAYDIRGVVDETLTEEIVYNIGLAIGSEAFARGQQTIIVGRDGRLSGPKFSAALINGLCAAGRDVIDIGQVPTPVVYFAAHYLNTGSGVMVTGSHNPPGYNGLKMVLKGETLAEGDIQALRRRIETGDFTSGSGSQRSQDVTADYIGTIVGDVHLARPLRVVIDCGNGVAGAVAPLLLRTLGCEVIELYCTVDGRFPNHHPDPSQLENLKDLIAAVAKHKADLGLALDGDGDRLALVDGNGKVIWPDRQMMLYAKDVLVRNPGAGIIFDIKCSRHLAKFITKLGGRPLMWKTGHSLIKRKMKETGALLAGEMSGHIFFKERWFGFDDGMYAAARLLEILAAERKSVAEVFQALPDAVSTPELRVDLQEGQQTVFMARLLKTANLKGAALTTIDGLRADFEDGWGLVRASNTTPSLILRFEANTEAALKRIKEEFRVLMRKVDPNVPLPF